MVYLVLVRMIHGHLPTTENLERNGLTAVYGPLARALRQGDLRLFERALEAQQAYYMRKELFLVIQLHLRNLILRSFLKKVYISADGGERSILTPIPALGIYWD